MEISKVFILLSTAAYLSDIDKQLGHSINVMYDVSLQIPVIILTTSDLFHI